MAKVDFGAQSVHFFLLKYLTFSNSGKFGYLFGLELGGIIGLR